MTFIKEAVYCPVCKKEGYLGHRYTEETFDGRCADCKVTYYYAPGKDTPYKNVTDRALKASKGFCGPTGCFCR